MVCENCEQTIEGPGVGHGRFCSERCYHTGWMRAKRQADPVAYREEMRRRREDPEFRERQRESARKSNAKNREKLAAQARGRYQKEKVRWDARRVAREAAERGRLTREPCLFCDEPKTQAHHHDYSQPLVVTWLCRRHHGLVHRKVA
jgi:hypothetical protein